MKLIKIFDYREDSRNKIDPKRVSARAVVKKGDEIYLVHLSKTDEYKFPGGGVELNETFEDALIRETLEESGSKITKIIECLGYIDQVYPDKYIEGVLFSLRSIYYLCEIKENYTNLNLSSREKALGFSPEWISIDEAISTNQRCLNNSSIHHWTERELYMLKYLKKYFEIS